jgi:non-ribosomal peptide synthetase component F
MVTGDVSRPHPPPTVPDRPGRHVTEYAPQFPAAPRPREDRTLVDVLLETAGNHPDQPALDDGARVLSYRELIIAIRDLALEMAAAGIGPGDKVGIRVPSGSVDLYLSILPPSCSAPRTCLSTSTIPMSGPAPYSPRRP